MNARLGKSNCHSSFPLFLPSLLHYRQMTGQSCRLSRRCFSSIRHHSITPCSLTSSSNKSLCLLMSLFISTRLVYFTFLTRPPAYGVTSFLILFLSLQSSHLCFLCVCMQTPSSLFPSRSDGFSPLCSFPCPPPLIPLSSSLQHSAQSIRYPSSLPPSIPKPLSPLCSPSFPRFPPAPPLTFLYLCIPLF